MQKGFSRLPLLRQGVGLCLGLFAFAAPTLADNHSYKSVTVGGEADLDACSAIGKVSGLNPNGDNVLSVRKGPSTDFERIDLVKTDQLLWLCQTEEDWYGVVYSQDDVGCKLSDPIAVSQAYSGPCKTGWVHGDYVTPMGG